MRHHHHWGHFSVKKLGWKGIPILIAVVVLLIWGLRPIFLSSYLTSRVGLPVTVGSISLSTKKTVFGDLTIKNPRGYKSKIAFIADTTTIEYDFDKVMGTPTEIDLLAIKKVFIAVDFDNEEGTKNNWKRIIAKMPHKTHKQKEILIHRLTLDDITIQIRGYGENVQPILKTVDHIELTEIDSKNGFPTHTLIDQVFKGAGIQDYIEGVFNPTSIERMFSPF